MHVSDAFDPAQWEGVHPRPHMDCSTGHTSPITKDKQALERLLLPYCEAAGVELVQSRVVHDSEGDVWRIYIDRVRDDVPLSDPASGVSLSDCQQITRALNHWLLSPELEVQYQPLLDLRIEVGSPGLDRPLVSPQHFQRFIGQPATLKLHVAIERAHASVKQKTFHGVLSDANAKGCSVRLEDGSQVSFQYDEIAEANLNPQISNSQPKQKKQKQNNNRQQHKQ